MDPKDTFFKKLQPLEDFAKLFEKSERFGTWNSKTLGIVLVSDKKHFSELLCEGCGLHTVITIKFSDNCELFNVNSCK